MDTELRPEISKRKCRVERVARQLVQASAKHHELPFPKLGIGVSAALQRQTTYERRRIVAAIDRHEDICCTHRSGVVAWSLVQPCSVVSYVYLRGAVPGPVRPRSTVAQLIGICRALSSSNKFTA